MLACPACQAPLPWPPGPCACGADWTPSGPIPDLFLAAGEDPSVTAEVHAFYEANPFPEWRPEDDLGSLVRRGRANAFTRGLDEGIPPRARVVEVGCGTGQMSLFLAVAGREVVGLDLSLASLCRAEAFRQRAGIGSARFVRANLFRAPLAPACADVVIANGVLHHTSDAAGALAALAALCRPGGHVVVGLYNRYGRALLPLYRGRHAKGQSARDRAWYLDQHAHPHETRHTAEEVLGWMEELGLEFVSSHPPLSLGEPDGPPFTAASAGSALGRLLAQLSWLGRAEDGGLWVMVGRRAHGG